MTDGVTVARAASRAGFRGKDLEIAVAVAFAESAFNENAVNDRNRNGSIDRGLWQINSVHRFPELESDAWRDPDTNARMAYRVFTSAGNKWTPWAAFNNGTYLAAYPAARAFVLGAGIDASAKGTAEEVKERVESVTAPLDAVQEAAADARDIAAWLRDPDSWLRVGKVIIGGWLVVVGVQVAVGTPIGKAAYGLVKGKVK